MFHYGRSMSSNIRVAKKCVECDGDFIARTTVTKFCSKLCNGRHYKRKAREDKLSNMKVKELSEVDKSYIEQVKKKEYLSIKEVVALIGVSRMSVYRYIKNGQLHSAKIGGRVIIPKTSIEALFNN